MAAVRNGLGVAGSYVLAPGGVRPPWERATHPLALDPRWGKVSAPRATNAWWTNLVVGDAASVATPYAVRVKGRMVEVGYGPPRRVVSRKAVSDPFAADVAIGFEDDDAGRSAARLVAADPLTATVEIDAPTRTILRRHRRKCVARFARGSPYVTLEFVGDGRDAVVLTSSSGVASVEADAAGPTDASCAAHAGCAGLGGDCCPTAKGVFLDCCVAKDDATGNKFWVVLGDGTRWRVYASREATLARHGKRVTIEDAGGGAFVGVLRAVVVPARRGADEELVRSLDSYATAYAVGSTVAWRIDGDVATLRFDWRVQGDGTFVALALPHHVASFSSNATTYDPALGGIWTSVKGDLAAVVGPTWETTEKLSKISWFAPRKSRDSTAVEILVQADVKGLDKGTDEPRLAAYLGVYSAGKRAARFAGIAVAAAAVGLDDEARVAAEATLRAVAPWLDPATRLLVYDTTYGGVCTRAGLDDSRADFGNGYYNDHHFHYGYLAYAAAVALKLLGPQSFVHHPATRRRRRRLETTDTLAAAAAETLAGRALATLVADVASDEPTAFFPFARHKDFYDGHSWASGLFAMADGRSQESVSEAANCYYAVSLLGDALDDARARDFARLLLALELRAAKTYWHIYSSPSIYPAPFSSTNLIAAVVGASDVSASTWFADGPAYAHLVNALPFSPVTEDLLAPRAYVAAAADDVAASLFHSEDALGPWHSLYIEMRAVVDPAAATRDVLGLALDDDPTLDATQSLSAMMYWATTRPPPDEATDDDIMGTAPAAAAAAPWLKDNFGNASSATEKFPALACAANPKCVNLGLRHGNCCPTPDGTMLWCCDST
ncbi:hypothetical protein CTAYLR_000226 [Chrysophaeum taylorii]|uniref:glucan endo-1,3-beta-D-glucosidase n=1 Tax=Chrysophaeum taylorii TaxID=2483200 RepID=A0AAD7UF90_9STRA|nr:hypothetical protein CTAYLR_000226 [Chrysophaeum taylorii]